MGDERLIGDAGRSSPEAGLPRSDGLVPATLVVAGLLTGVLQIIVIAFPPSVRSSD